MIKAIERLESMDYNFVLRYSNDCTTNGIKSANKWIVSDNYVGRYKYDNKDKIGFITGFYSDESLEVAINKACDALEKARKEINND